MTAALPGKDFSDVLAAPERAAVNAVRDGALFNYNMFAYLDGIFSTRPSHTSSRAAIMIVTPDGLY